MLPLVEMMMDDIETIIKVLSEDGWTCEYHEPDPKCRVCERLHKNTAERILDALGTVQMQLPRDDQVWVSTSGGRFQVINADGQSEDTVEPRT